MPGTKTTFVLANLEHEFRIPRNPVWICLARRQHVAHLSNVGGQSGRTSGSVDCSALDGLIGAADHRILERPYVEPEVGETTAVFHDWGHLEFGCVVHNAAQFGVVDGGGTTLGA